MALKSSKVKPRKTSTPAGARRTTAKKRRRPGKAEEAAWISANSYCLCTYGMACSAGAAYRLSLADTAAWVFPVVLTSPGYGIVGTVGMVVVEAATGTVAGATPRPAVSAAAQHLAEEHRDEIDAAFHRARKL